MGTRADFYIGRGEQAEWLGSVAWDGYPEGIPTEIKEATNEETYRAAVTTFIQSRDDGTPPKDGWPWPWEDSNTTDYAYALDDGSVWAACFGYFWHKATETPPSEDDHPEMWESQQCIFPNMKDRQNVSFGKNSGLIILGAHNNAMNSDYLKAAQKSRPAFK